MKVLKVRNGVQDMVKECRANVTVVMDEDAVSEHERRGHEPYDGNCETCIAAKGREKRHERMRSRDRDGE